jgi:hypothetical protein
MRRYRVEFLFEPRDLWVGLFWDRRPNARLFYICLVPTLVIKITRGCA